MFEREAGGPQGGRQQHRRGGTAAGCLPSPVSKGLLALGCAAVALAISVQAFAQGNLPPLKVETATPKKAKAKAKAAPPQVAEPPPEVQPAATGDKARSEAVYKTPAGISIATKSDIETFGKADVGDVLRSMPGVSTRDPQGAGLAVNIRGFEGSGRVNMMIDGVRQSFKFTGHEAQGFLFVDPALLAGIDVMRGAVSGVGGAGALAGAANMRTLDVEDILTPGKKTGVLSTITYGTNGVGWQEMLAGAAQSGGIGIAGAISHREPNAYDNGGGVTVPFTDQNLLSGLFKINFALSPEQTLKLGAVLYDNDFFANSYFQNVTSETYTLKYAYKPFANPLIDFAFNAHMNRVRVEYFHDATPTVVDPCGRPTCPPTHPKGSAAGRIIADSGTGFDVSNTSRFALGGISVAATYGYEYFGDEFRSFNILQPDAGGGVNPSGESSIAGLFSQTKFSYGIFDLIAGLRYDTYTLDGTYVVQPGSPHPLGLPPGTYKLDESYERLNPKVTLAAQVLPWLQPYVIYSETSRAPTLFETVLGGNHPGGGFSFKANPFLEPEVQKGWEIGANIRKDGVFTPGDAFRFKLGYFDMDVENYIAGSFTKLIFENIPGTSQVKGVELEAKYDAGVFFGSLAYTYTDTNLASQVDGLGAHSFLPEHIAVLTAGVRLLDQKLTLGTRVSYFSESHVGDPNVGQVYFGPEMPGYTLVDLFSSYKFDNGLVLGLTATNILDVEYTPALATPFTADGVCFGNNSPGCNGTGMGRTLLLTAKMQF
jgi:hemoglobin/transferrin/lactoferrin receptor protein